MLGQAFVNLHNIFGDVCHNRSQTLYVVVHVVLQCGILLEHTHAFTKKKKIKIKKKHI